MTISLLRMPAVQARTGLSRSTIYDRINPNSKRFDPAFPKPISLDGGGGGRAIGFVESEVDDYLKHLVELSRRVKSVPVRGSERLVTP